MGIPGKHSYLRSNVVLYTSVSQAALTSDYYFHQHLRWPVWSLTPQAGTSQACAAIRQGQHWDHVGSDRRGTGLRDHFVNAPSQWETTLPCNIVSHWMVAYTRWFLRTVNNFSVNYDIHTNNILLNSWKLISYGILHMNSVDVLWGVIKTAILINSLWTGDYWC